jgi:hypothetical protein
VPTENGAAEYRGSPFTSEVSAVPETTGPSPYRQLPPPVRLEDLRTSAETHPVHEEKDDYWREVEWMLRVAGGA